MKNDLAPSGQILTAAMLPVGLLVVVALVIFWLAFGWHQDANAARVQAAHDHADAVETEKRVSFLRGSKERVDQMWLELSAGTVRVTSGPSGGINAPSGPSVNLGDVPLNKGAAASSGLSSGSRPRDLPESLNALAEADFVIIPQPAASDRNFRRYAVGSDRIEFGRLLPLVASVETRFPLALLEEAIFSLPASQPVFSTEPHAMETRLVVRLPLYDPAARVRDQKNRQKPGAARPAASASSMAKS